VAEVNFAFHMVSMNDIDIVSSNSVYFGEVNLVYFKNEMKAQKNIVEVQHSVWTGRWECEN
jgi:hypothetical protein